MRLRLTIRPKTGELLLTRNYMRQLTSAFWRVLNLPEEKESGLPKLVCFSPLFFKERKIEGDKIRLKGKSGQFLVSSPLKVILEKTSTLSGKEVEIGGNICNIVSVDIEDKVNFEDTMVWRTLPGSGICNKKPSLEKTETFVFPSRDGKDVCEQSISNTLQTRWKTLCKRDINKAILWSDDSDPLKWAGSNLPTITIISFDGMRQEKIKTSASFMAWDGQIKVEGSVAWQRLIWDCGLGIKTGIGCGMVEPGTKKMV